MPFRTTNKLHTTDFRKNIFNSLINEYLNFHWNALLAVKKSCETALEIQFMTRSSIYLVVLSQFAIEIFAQN